MYFGAGYAVEITSRNEQGLSKLDTQCLIRCPQYSPYSEKMPPRLCFRLKRQRRANIKRLAITRESIESVPRQQGHYEKVRVRLTRVNMKLFLFSQ